MLTSYGQSTIIKTTIACILAGLGSWLFPPAVRIPVIAMAAAFFIFTLYFFRDPERTPPEGIGNILAPADGTVVLIEKRDNSYTGPASTLVSIFMSPLNVHVNRIPIDGTVSVLHYRPGKFGMAFDHRSMEENERMEIGIAGKGTKILFSQVSGFLARRIVCPLTTGEGVKAGNRFGMIKFGSRVDVFLPEGTEPTVLVGEKTKAGETILAKL